MTLVRLPVESKCQQCNVAIPAHTPLLEEQGKFFCSEVDGLTWRQQQRRSRTDRILDLCIAGMGLREAIVATA